MKNTKVLGTLQHTGATVNLSINLGQWFITDQDKISAILQRICFLNRRTIWKYLLLKAMQLLKNDDVLKSPLQLGYSQCSWSQKLEDAVRWCCSGHLTWCTKQIQTLQQFALDQQTEYLLLQHTRVYFHPATDSLLEWWLAFSSIKKLN